MAWALGLAFGLCGCADLSPGLARTGFGHPVPFRTPQPGATLAERRRLYLEHRVTVNQAGFQVGLAPTDGSGLAEYLGQSGNAEACLRLSSALGRQGQIDQAMALAPLGALWPVGLVAAAVAAPVLIRADEAKRAIAMEGLNAALSEDQRLARVLGLPVDPGDAIHPDGLPGPLKGACVDVGTNRSLADWAWDRSVHRGMEGWLAGGRPLPQDRVLDYLRSQGADDEAGRYARGQGLRKTGDWLTLGGLTAIGLSLGAYLYAAYHRQATPTWAAPIGISGLVGAPLGYLVSVAAGGLEDEVLADFNQGMPGRLRLHLAPVSGPDFVPTQP